MEDNSKNFEEELRQNIEPASKYEIVITDKKSKKGTKVLLIIVGVLMLAGIVTGLLIWNEFSNYNRKKEGEYYVVFAENLNLAQKKSKDSNDKATFTVVRKLPFGTEVEIIFKDSVQQDNKTYYRCTYCRLNGSVEENFERKENYYLEMTTFDDELDKNFDIDRCLRTFPIKDAQRLPASVKRFIYNDLFNPNYSFTQDANRIKKAIVLADFNMDGEQDAAVIMEDDNRSNILLVLCYNKDLKKSYLAYNTYTGSSAAISLFKKDAKIFMNSEDFVKAPSNGIIYETLDGSKEKYAIFYNPETMQFEQYIQKPLSEIQKKSEYESEPEDTSEDEPEPEG